MVVRMILSCPSCHARFSVADHLIPPEGRVVRCSRCAHAWEVIKTSFSSPLPEPEITEKKIPVPASPQSFEAELQQQSESLSTAIPEVDASIPDFDKIELPKPRKKFSNPGRRASDRTGLRNPKIYKIAAPVLAACWVVLAFFTYLPSWSKAPVLSGIYKALGATPTEGLSFIDVTMTREQEGSKTKFILAGSIRNASSEARLVPTVRVLLKDKQNKTLWGREYPVNTELKAGEVYPFRISNVETAFAKSVARIAVDMGNPMQLMVR